jgi:hypothetical protein
MTAKQNAYYWRLWNQACQAKGWRASDGARRHQVHVEALGFDLSHEDFSNEHFDCVIRAMQLLANPDNLAAVMFLDDPASEQRKRLLWRIEQTAPREYVRSVAADKFGTVYYHDLSAAQLEMLRNTVVNRMRAKQKQEEREQQEVALANERQPDGQGLLGIGRIGE